MDEHNLPPSSIPTPDGNTHEPPTQLPPRALPVAPPPRVPRCMNCGYELTGMRVEDRCPECGALVWEQHKVPPTSGFAITSLVLGIVSIVSCFGIGPLAILPAGLGIVFGELASRQHKQGQRAGGTYGMALAGRICAWIGMVLGLAIAAIIFLPMLGYW